jgi:polysaccharide pyruvyl transferase WcaK-like protein
VNPLPYFDPRFWAESDASVYARYVDLLAAFGARLLEQGHQVHFIPTQLRADPPVIADIVHALERLPSAASAAGVRPAAPSAGLSPAVSSFDDLMARLAEADVVVATRFHGVVLAQMLGKPTIGIAYRRSTTDLLADVGQGAYSIEIGALTLEGLWDRLRALEQDEGAARRIAARMEEYRRALDAQYDRVLGPAGGGAALGAPAP